VLDGISQELSASGQDIGASEEIPDAVLPDSMPDLPDSTLVASPESAAPEPETVH
jgi:hypothetical protein